MGGFAAVRGLIAGFVLSAATPVVAELYINEIFYGIGNNGFEARDEFIELRGAPGMPLDNYFLLFIESEDNATHTGGAGKIDNIFDLTGVTMGSNGFLAIRQGGDGIGSGPSQYSVVPGATDLINTGTGPGYGSGATSTIGAEDDFNEGVIENGGFTAMLIRNLGDPVTNRPTIAFDLDVGNDGLDVPTGREGWEILDAIGIHSEPREAVFGRTYAPITFGFEAIGDRVVIPGAGLATANPGLEPGGEYVGLKYEIEYIARWGNSTGQTAADWHISNLTDNPGSGSEGAPLDWRQSFTGEHGDLASNDDSVPPSQPTTAQGKLESNQSVPYGTKLLTNIGGPNYLTGDYNHDGYVDAADYTVWRDTSGETGTESAHPDADHNHDFMVNGDDYTIWSGAYGAPNGSAPAPTAAVPEPAALALLAAGWLGGVARKRG
ncbi:hypothetical protein Pla108_34000 [Botrimarina colliarenosi]|uniref:PEP-CTERM protein-sorting domain-containing protein n=1 Tax=Botrimarina colliarenosi TaxID=2528001 RepID=A0A5C6A745_9BACT|nr:hypothetical protein [Botrimarina colliarenosi]TWT95256.1 hypothetical protein Pla108_34000 [Botrimarina colliarenosi]